MWGKRLSKNIDVHHRNDQYWAQVNFERKALGLEVINIPGPRTKNYDAEFAMMARLHHELKDKLYST